MSIKSQSKFIDYKLARLLCNHIRLCIIVVILAVFLSEIVLNSSLCGIKSSSINTIVKMVWDMMMWKTDKVVQKKNTLSHCCWKWFYKLLNQGVTFHKTANSPLKICLRLYDPHCRYYRPFSLLFVVLYCCVSSGKWCCCGMRKASESSFWPLISSELTGTRKHKGTSILYLLLLLLWFICLLSRAWEDYQAKFDAAW